MREQLTHLEHERKKENTRQTRRNSFATPKCGGRCALSCRQVRYNPAPMALPILTAAAAAITECVEKYDVPLVVVTENTRGRSDDQCDPNYCWLNVSTAVPSLPAGTPHLTFETDIDQLCKNETTRGVITIGAPASLQPGIDQFYTNSLKMQRSCDLFSRMLVPRGGIKVNATHVYGVHCVFLGDSSSQLQVANATSRLVHPESGGFASADFLLGPYGSGLTTYASKQAVLDSKLMIAPASSDPAVYSSAAALAQENGLGLRVFGMLPRSSMRRCSGQRRSRDAAEMQPRYSRGIVVQARVRGAAEGCRGLRHWLRCWRGVRLPEGVRAPRRRTFRDLLGRPPSRVRREGRRRRLAALSMKLSATCVPQVRRGGRHCLSGGLRQRRRVGGRQGADPDASCGRGRLRHRSERDGSKVEQRQHIDVQAGDAEGAGASAGRARHRRPRLLVRGRRHRRGGGGGGAARPRRLREITRDASRP